MTTRTRPSMLLLLAYLLPATSWTSARLLAPRGARSPIVAVSNYRRQESGLSENSVPVGRNWAGVVQPTKLAPQGATIGRTSRSTTPAAKKKTRSDKKPEERQPRLSTDNAEDALTSGAAFLVSGVTELVRASQGDDAPAMDPEKSVELAADAAKTAGTLAVSSVVVLNFAAAMAKAVAVVAVGPSLKLFGIVGAGMAVVDESDGLDEKEAKKKATLGGRVQAAARRRSSTRRPAATRRRGAAAPAPGPSVGSSLVFVALRIALGAAAGTAIGTRLAPEALRRAGGLAGGLLVAAVIAGSNVLNRGGFRLKAQIF